MNSYRWVILAIVWLLYAAFGLNMRSMAPVVTPMLADLKMNYGEMGLILGSWQLVYIPFSIITGIAMDRWGIRKTLFVGALILAFSEALRYYATGFLTLLPTVALFGVGGPLISIGAPKAVSLWFKERDRGAAVGIYTTAPWIGGLFAIAATNSLIMPLTGHSWRLTFVLYGALTLLFALIWLVLARDVKQEHTQDAASLKSVFARILKVRNVKLALLGGLITLFIDHGFSHWLPKMLENGGATSQTAGFMASISLFAAIPAVFFVPRLVPQRHRGRFLAMLSFLTSAGLVIASTIPSLVIPGLILYGLTTPTLLPLLMLTMMDEPQVGSASMGLAGGIFFAIAEIGGFSGPLMMGIMADATNSFFGGVLILAASGIFFSVLMLMLRNPEAAR